MLALDEHLARRPRHSAPRQSCASAPLAALAGDMLGGRFRSWLGHSGRRYVFSVYDAASCPPYEHAVMIVAAASSTDERRVAAIVDTGCFPDVAMAKAAGGAVELHVHLLAQSRAERDAVIADLAHLYRS